MKFSTFLWLFILCSLGSLILIFASFRVGEHKSSTYGATYEDFKKSWGGETSVPPIQFFFVKKVLEKEYNSDSGIEKYVTKTEEIPVIPNSIEYHVNVIYKEQSRGWLSFNAFEAIHSDIYYMVNNGDASGDLYMRITKPNETTLLNAIHITVDGLSKDDQFKTLSEPILLKRNFGSNSKLKLAVDYTEKGMEILKYAISIYENEIISSLKATFEINTSEFEIYRFGLPHKIELNPNGSKLTFELKNFVTNQDLGISFYSKSIYLDRIESLIQTSPLSLIIFIIVLFVFGQIKEIRFHSIHYLLYSIICIFYFLFVTYLIRFIGVFPSFGLAGLLTGLMFVLYSPNVVGWEFSLKILAPYLVTVTLCLSLTFLLPVFKGITFVTLIFILCISIMISIGKSNVENWPINKE
ncbi:hypothetical protein [Leptospira santarosai]|uniref:hypothetical protein n=1 Tax=Leptospira santarosai TaxID=28183 RepID=UPI0024AF61A9|nr:hypothetical protein [Leptospira santarosai]MDI7224555.1 hypothetical protein [Leptospira santarosai]